MQPSSHARQLQSNYFLKKERFTDQNQCTFKQKTKKRISQGNKSKIHVKPDELTLQGIHHEVKTMSSSTFGGATNFVFWDAGDCKIPEGSTYAGMVKIFVYRTLAQVWTEDPPNLEKEIKVTIIPNEDQHWKHMKMMTDILMAWVDEEYIPANILFISGDMDMEISHLLYRLKMRGSNILLGQLEDKPRMFLPDTHTLWRWESLSIGGEPIAESFRPIRHPQPAEPIEQTGRRKRLRLGWQ